MSILPGLRTFAVGITFAVVLPAWAQLPRQVMVNGVLLNKAQLRVLDSLNCGVPVPNGIYWIEASGAWGYPGGGPEGILGEDCAAPKQPPPQDAGKSECEKKYRYHEDRMCYCCRIC